ncbi:MAG: FadR/GntR family transcriptional regulator [Marmoricola sp.]
MPRLSRVGQTAVFAPLAQESRPELVARSLADAIALGIFADDHQLPAETELAARFAVSLTTVRHALGILRQRGLLETRRGRHGGSFVQAPDDPARRVLEVRLRDMSSVEIRDLADHYTAIGGQAAALAAQRADDDDLDRLFTAAGAVVEAETPRERRRTEGLFHIEVAAAAQSARLTREEISLQRDIAPLLWLPQRPSPSKLFEEHEQICAAIKAHDPESARRHAEKHIARSVDEVLRMHRRIRAAGAGTSQPRGSEA